jgi:two-component system KDP operon response regulator KdpE
VPLAPSESTLLGRLAVQPGVVVAYERLLEEVGLDGSPRGRPALRSCVLRLRRKIEREPLHPEIVLAENGVGYRLAPPTFDLARRLRDSLPDDRK